MSTLTIVTALVALAALCVMAVVSYQRHAIKEPTALQVAAAQLEITKLDALEAHKAREHAEATVRMLADRERRLRDTVRRLSAEAEEVAS